MNDNNLNLDENSNDSNDVAVVEEIEKQLQDPVRFQQQKENHKKKFEEWLNKNYEEKNTSFVLKKKDVDYIHDILKGVKKIESAQQKFQFQKKIIFCQSITLFFAR